MPDDLGREAFLHGLFSLREGVPEDSFGAAFDASVAHLVAAGFACGGQFMRRTELEGFGEGLPDFAYYTCIDFPSVERERACYDYVAAGSKPVMTVHHAMNVLVRRGSAHFFVTAN